MPGRKRFESSTLRKQNDGGNILAIQYETLETGNFLDVDGLQAYVNRGFHVVSHAVYASDQNNQPKDGPNHYYIFAYRGGIAASSSITQGSRG